MLLWVRNGRVCSFGIAAVAFGTWSGMLAEKKRQQKVMARVRGSTSGLLKAWNQLLSLIAGKARMQKLARRLHNHGLVKALNQCAAMRIWRTRCTP